MLLARAVELAALEGRLARDAPVALLGPAGIGKTALLREAAASSGRATFEGGGLSTLSWLPHLPLARALGRSPPPGDSAAVAAFVAEEVADGVLIVDDLQWADPATAAAVVLLAGRVGLLTALRRGDPASAARLEQLEGAGVEPLEVPGLDEADALALVRGRRPDLPDDAVRRVAERAGGNPLMLEQLALGNGSVERLRLGLGARLLEHGRAAREAVARLALLGRPAEPGLVGEHLGELLEADLLIERNGMVELRHELLGQAAIRELDAPALRRRHSELARTLTDPAEAARHHRAAGERGAAHAKALAAATRSSRVDERASHLALAAACAEGRDADGLRLRAAEELIEAGDHHAALELAHRVDLARQPELAARLALLRARGLRLDGDRAGAEAALATGLAEPAAPEAAVEVDLRLERAWLAAEDLDGERVTDLAQEALKFARAAGVREARAEAVVALALMVACSPDCIPHARRAMERARRDGDGALELEAAFYLVMGLGNFGHPAASRELAGRMAVRAREFGLRARELEFLHIQAHDELHAFGELESATERNRALLREPRSLEALLRTRTRVNLALCRAYAGDLSEAESVLEEAGGDAASVDERAFVAWALAELHWLAGTPRAALDLIEERRREPTMMDAYMRVLEGWAALDAGTRPPPPLERAPLPLFAGAVPESRALARLAGGDPAGAERLFLEAAELWAGRVLFAEIRALWGVGIAALRQDSPERARWRLLEAERRARAAGIEPLLARVRRSLRQAGIPRSAPRTRGAGVITGREHEVLELVAAGLSSREIAARLGVAASTVDSQVRSAMRKLGARTRAQAALTAAGEGD
jgi:DNA-binding CsgD family transcriptional regulator